jgi:hypothetical protein
MKVRRSDVRFSTDAELWPPCKIERAVLDGIRQALARAAIESCGFSAR